MPKVFLGLGTNVDRERSMRAGLEALKTLDPQMVVSSIYESEAVGFDGPPFYNCVVQINTQLSLVDLIVQLKAIENANGRNRSNQAEEGKGLDIDVLTYGDLVGRFEGVELPRPDITQYAHVLFPLSEIAPDECSPGSDKSYQRLWAEFDSDLVPSLKAVTNTFSQ